MDSLSPDELMDLHYILTKGDDHHIEQLMGAGFFSDSISRVKRWLSPCLCYSNATKKALKEYGDYMIEDMTIYRTPLDSLIKLALNGLTFGKWSTLMKKFGFDKFYHLALVITIRVGNHQKKIIIEKNEVINVSTAYKTSANTESLSIRGNFHGRTISDLLLRTRRAIGDDTYYLYDAFSNNCQYFIRYILQSNGLLSEEADQFLFQDIAKLSQELPNYVKSTARGLTDTAATLTKVLGRGRAKRAI